MAGTSTRRKRGRPPGRHLVAPEVGGSIRRPKYSVTGSEPSPVILSQVAAMRAEGMSTRQVAGALGISDKGAWQLCSRPETIVEAAKRRELLKYTNLQHIEETLTPAWEMAKAAIREGDAKGFDATTRGLHAIEKIASSVSGESLRVEHSGQVQVDTRPAVDELRILIAMVKGEAR